MRIVSGPVHRLAYLVPGFGVACQAGSRNFRAAFEVALQRVELAVIGGRDIFPVTAVVASVIVRRYGCCGRETRKRNKVRENGSSSRCSSAFHSGAVEPRHGLAHGKIGASGPAQPAKTAATAAEPSR